MRSHRRVGRAVWSAVVGALLAGGAWADPPNGQPNPLDPNPQRPNDPTPRPSGRGGTAAGGNVPDPETDPADEPPDAAERTDKSRLRHLVALLAQAAKRNRAAFLAAAQGDALDEAITRLPADCPAALATATADARRLIGRERWKDALDKLNPALAGHGEFVAPRLVAAAALAGLGQTQDAFIRQIDPTLLGAPADADARHVSALLLWGRGDLPAAREDLVRALAARTGDARLLLSLGVLDLERRAWQDAARSLAAAAKARSADAVAWRALARSQVHCGAWTGAVGAFEHVVALVEHPDPAQPPAAPATPVVAIEEHLALTILYADRVADPVKAKEHATAFVQGGGVDTALSEWLAEVLAK